MSCFRPDEWQYQASERLQVLLTSNSLRRLAGDLERALRADRRAESGSDRPSQVGELADALLIARDADLFADAAVRKAVVAAIRKQTGQKVDNPARWVAGQTAAHRFVHACGFPPELAGRRARGRPESVQLVMPPAVYRRLKPYQEEVRNELLQRLDADAPANRAMVSLPTGAGKTRVAVESLHQWAHRLLEDGGSGQVVLVWLAHTEELCEQAVASFEDVWRSHPAGSQPLLLARFWGGFRRDLDRQEIQDRLGAESPLLVLVSTPQSFIDEQLEGLPRPAGIVVDEAHRAAAPTYRRIIGRHGATAAIIGLTATPYRREFDRKDPQAGTAELRELFQHLVVAESLGLEAGARLTRLQEMGVLSRPVSRTVNTGITLKVGEPPQADGMQQLLNFDQELQHQADQTRRRRIVLAELLEILETHSMARVLYFGPSVLDAELVAFMLRYKGRRAAAVSGTTRASTRRAMIADFKAGRIDVLCNCEVLTTGFDAPTVTHVVMGRPTISQVLYEQMVGRGLRGPEFGGTEYCHIVDFEDRYRARKPILGYEQFRDVWLPLEEEPERDIASLGLLVQLGPGDVKRYSRNERQVAACRSRPVGHGVQIPVLITLEGSDSGTLLVMARDPAQAQATTRRRYELNLETPVIRTHLDVPRNCALLLQATTADPRGHIEVRRYDPRVANPM